MSNAILNLDTLVNRPKITIDGERYEILAPEELSVITSHVLAAGGRRMDELMKSGELGDGEKAELLGLVQSLGDTIMEPVPAAIRAKLSDAHRLSVIEAFTALLLTKKAGTAAAMIQGLLGSEGPKKPLKPTGAKSSRGSSASTGRRRTTGSGKPRSHS